MVYPSTRLHQIHTEGAKVTLGNAAFTASYILLWVVVVVQALILVEVLRQIGILRRRMPPESGALL